MTNTHYSVKPRYTPGSGAWVPMEVASKVAVEEKVAHEHALSGRMGEKDQALAEKAGLGLIVIRFYDDEPKGVRHCHDLITGEEWTLRLNGEHLDVHMLPPRVRDRDDRDGARPDFAGFAKALRDEAAWSATIHKDDTTGQAATDQAALNRLAATVERVGKNLGYL